MSSCASSSLPSSCVVRGGLRRGRHFQDLDELVVVALAVERQAERQRQRRRAIEFAMRAVDHLEAHTSCRRFLFFAWRIADGQEDRKGRNHGRDDRQHSRLAAPSPELSAVVFRLSFDVHGFLPRQVLQGF
jgi:hypothetical protein